MKPLLAHVYEPHRVTYPCYVQPKLNGIRALYQNGRFQSRDEIPFGVELLRHLSEPLLSTFGAEVILDGELYVHGWPLQRINAAVTPVRQHPTEDTVKVEYHVFDVVDFEKSFEARITPVFDELVSLNMTSAAPIRHVESYFVDNENFASERYAHFVSDGYEGMMYRLGDCPYTVPKQPMLNDYTPFGVRPRSGFRSDKNNRTWHLLKRKDWQDDEFTCIGVEEGEGKYKGMAGALRCVTSSGERFTVGSGLSDMDRAFYLISPPVGRFIKVKYLVLSNAGIPLNPTILAIL